MDRTEFYYRQADRFSKLARECVDAETSAKLREIATEYREMLNGKAPVDADHRPIARYAASVGGPRVS